MNSCLMVVCFGLAALFFLTVVLGLPAWAVLGGLFLGSIIIASISDGFG